MQTTTFRIEGMSCDHCVRAVREALQRVPGVEVRDVKVGSAVVRYDAAKTKPEALADVIRDAGYEARELTAA